RRPELDWLVLPASQQEIYLPEPEEIEVVDPERGGQNGQPSSRAHQRYSDPRRRVLHAPDHAANRLPLPEQQQETNAGQKYIGAALNLRRNHPSPRPLEPLPGHYAVLNGEQAEQAGIDEQRSP